MNHKLKLSVIGILTAMMVSPVGMANNDDRSLFRKPHSGYDVPMVRGGEAPIDEALGRIVPPPYRILVDESIPTSLYVVWGSGDNWMDILRRAVAPFGLAIKPDWAKNTIEIVWPDRPSTVDRVENKRSETVAASISKPPGDFVVVGYPEAAADKASRPHGDFVVVEQQEAAAIDVSRPAETSDDARPVVLAQFETFEKSGKLPGADVMWRLMQAAVNGDKIVLSGISSLSNEKLRARYANTYAGRLRTSLLAVGFPASAVVVAEDAVSLGKRGGVKIEIIKGNV